MASALADWRAIRSGSVFRPRSASQASNGPGMPPPLDRQALSVRQQPGVAADHGAQDDVGVPGYRLGQRVQRGRRAGVERPLEQSGGHGVVDHHGRARRGRDPGQPGQVGHPEQRVGRRLGPQQGRSGRQFALDGRQVPQVHRDRAGAVWPQAVRQHPAPVVAVLRQHDALAPRGQRQHQRHRGRLAGGEGHRLRVLQAAERLLERLPAGVAVPAVTTARARGPLRDVHARRDEGRRGGLAGCPFGARVDQPGFGGEYVSHRRRRMLQYNL